MWHCEEEKDEGIIGGCRPNAPEGVGRSKSGGMVLKIDLNNFERIKD